jgi:hypothetical protein
MVTISVHSCAVNLLVLWLEDEEVSPREGLQELTAIFYRDTCVLMNIHLMQTVDLTFLLLCSPFPSCKQHGLMDL